MELKSAISSVFLHAGKHLEASPNLMSHTVPFLLTGNSTNWTPLENVPEFSKATGKNGYVANTTVDFGGRIIKSVRITANSNWGTTSSFNKYGLSEVLFLALPLDAGMPSPRNGARNVALDPILSWRAGREAAEHYVYFNTDKQAVIDSTALVDTIGQASYGPLSLVPGRTYFWRVDEVNNAEVPATWQGSIWSFSTQEYLVVDDFEDYNDVAGTFVYLTWIDGYVEPPAVRTNGSTIGYVELYQPTMETDIVHGGNQSVPLSYDNTNVAISEVTVNTNNLAVGQDWTSFSTGTLSLWFYGDPNNATTEQMYVKLNDSKVVFDGDPNSLILQSWHQWNIDLSAFSVDLSNVTELSIGFEKTEATGGSGMVFIDDIRLYVLLNDQAILEQ